MLTLAATIGSAGCGFWNPDDDGTLPSSVWTPRPPPPRDGETDPAPPGEPELRFTVTTAFCCDARALVFSVADANVPPFDRAGFTWNFGDGRTGRGEVAEHAYAWPGDYLVQLTATFPDGTTRVAQQALSLPGEPVPDGEDPDVPQDDPAPVVARAGPDVRVTAGQRVTLDGSQSTFDPDQPVGWEWRQVGGSAVTLSDPSAPQTTFIAPTDIDGESVLLFALIVRQSAMTGVDNVQVTVWPPEPPTVERPEVRLALTLSDGRFLAATEPTADPTTPDALEFSGEWGEAVIRTTDGSRYELDLQVTKDVTQVWFPWFPDLYSCRRILYPHVMGMEIANDRLGFASWSDPDIAVYPGQTVFPGAIMDDTDRARAVYALNWPPQPMNVLYSRGRVTIRYDQWVPAGQRQVYLGLVVDAAADLSREAWHAALDPYKSWLRTQMQAETLWPVHYPQWLRDAHGWSNVQLQNYDDPVGEVRYRWESWGEMFPVIQTWGSMSDRHHPPDTATGCCLIDTSLHPRNAELPALAATIAAQGGRMGYYARPRNTGPVAGPDLNAQANRDFLLNWLIVNKAQLGGNIDYLDWFIARPIGPVLEVAKQFRYGIWGTDTVCERAVDVYPTAFLMSGALWGGHRFFTTAEETLDEMPAGQIGISFPRLVRYALDDRIILLGESNGDHSLWGTSRGGWYWGERTAFLLGCKLDWMQHPDSGGPNNPVVLDVVEAWRESDFWARDPVYMDTIGLAGVPSTTDVRRFQGRDGETILAIDHQHPDSVEPGVIQVDGRTVEIPGGRWLEIVVVEP